MDLRKTKEKNGITLIALVITIIIMLILAGVSLNATIGDNGIITKATQASILSQVGMIEEYFQTLRIEYVDITSETDLQAIMDAGYRNYFLHTSDGYCMKKTYKDTLTGDVQTLVLYLILVDQLPIEISDNLTIGKNATTKDYKNLTNVVGITSDLKVYYCENGLESMMGLSLADINADSPDIVAYEPDSPLASIINGGESEITNQGLKSITTLTIDNGNEIAVLKDVDRLVNLTTMYFTNVSIDTLEGLEYATGITYVKFENSTCSDYSALCGLTNLQRLYIVKPTGFDEDIRTLGSADKGIANAQFSKLTYFGIVGNNYNIGSGWDYGGRYNITDISSLANLSDTTKQAIKYLYLNNLQLTSLAGISEFTNVYRLEIFSNALTTFEGIQNMSKLTYIYAKQNYSNALGKYSLGSNETATKSETTDALSYIYKSNGTNNSLYYLDLVNNSNIKWLGYLNGCSNLKYLYLTSCTNLQDVSTITNIIKNCSSYYIDSKYALNIANGAKILDLKGLTVTKDEFETALLNNTTIQYLRMSGLKITDNSGNSLTRTSTPTYDSIVNSILKTCINLKCVWMETCTDMTTIEFVKNTPNLTELMINKTYITTNNGDNSKNGLELLNSYCPNLGVIALGSLDSNVDITLIQPALIKVSTNFSDYSRGNFETSGDSCRGVNICGEYERDKLSDCTDLTIFRGYCGGWEYKVSGTADMSACTELKNIYYGYASMGIKCPASAETVLMAASDMDKWDLSGAINVKTISIVITGGNASSLTRILQQLQDKRNLRYLECMITWQYDTTNFSLLKDTGLTSLVIHPYGGYPQNIGYVTKLGGIAEITTLTSLSCYGDGLKTLEGIGNLSNLTYLDIHYNQLRDLNGIEELQNLTKLIVYGNQINDIYPLKSLPNLEYVDLQTNALTDMSSYNGIGYQTIDIFLDMNYTKNGKLKNLYISGNNIEETERLLEVNWSGKNGF